MKAVRIWLYSLCLMIFLMVLLGGITRLTNSGLSITVWEPLIGAIPPLSTADWHQLFAQYQQIPQFHQLNPDMDLAGFKSIFWWEWTHRFFGRMIGVVLVVPWIIFTLMGRIPRDLQPKLFVMLLLGGLQGAMGWYMVKSGLVDRVEVSQYRLAAHLLFAAFILAFILWVALGLKQRREFDLVLPVERADVFLAGTFAVFVFLQIGLGALVAGLRAGLVYNTWPTMDGAWLPDGLLFRTPVLVNFFENATTVQFDHRMMAYLVLLTAVVQAFRLARKSAGTVRNSTLLVAGLVLVQVILGITTLLLHVPLDLALAHQALAFITFIAAVRHFYLVKRAHAVS